jgi:hypothetical protein
MTAEEEVTPSSLNYSNTHSQGPRPDRICSGIGSQAVAEWFNTTRFTTTALSAALAAGTPRFGDSGLCILVGPGALDWDFGLFKNCNLGNASGYNSGWGGTRLAK